MNEGTLTVATFPDDYLELHRLVKPDSKEGAVFQKEMDDVGATHALIRDNNGKIIKPTDTGKVDQALGSGGSVEVYTPGDKSNAAKKEMPLLGNALAESLKALGKDKPLAAIMHEQIEKVRAAGENPAHLIRTERGLLAQQDCLRHLDAKDMTDIFAGIYNGGGKKSLVHADIRKVLEQRVAAGEFGEVSGGAKAALGAAKLLGQRGVVSDNGGRDLSVVF